jgi:tRNA threonylcarbamoyladenosine biosynthesis protein TsaE
MAVERELLSTSPEATEALGERLGALLPPGALVCLDGELGSGKTCFVRGLARGLGIQERVSSPTYALLQTYSGRLELLHFDAWMEGRERAFLLDGGLDGLDARAVAVVEWAERVLDVLPTPRVRIALRHAGPAERELSLCIEGTGRLAQALERALVDVALPAGVREVSRQEAKERRDRAQ